MATTAAPYGLRPINLIGGQVFAGSTRQLKIASGYAANIFFGDVVAIGTDGTIVKVTNVGTNADQFPAGTVGVFVGVSVLVGVGVTVGAAAPSNWEAKVIHTASVALLRSVGADSIWKQAKVAPAGTAMLLL